MSRLNSESDSRIKVGIVTMFSGENEIGIQRDSLNCQQGVDFEQFLIEGLSKIEAHSVFRNVVERDELRADLYVKLDADMAFMDRSALKRITNFFEANPNLCHLVTPVQDWPSNRPIYGAHVYRTGVKFPYKGTGLFTDPNPKISGTRLTLELNHEPLISHMPDPSESQCYLLGYHRALKVIQKGVLIKDFQNARFQLDYLENISSANEINPDSRRDCVLLGAWAVLSGRLSASTFEKSDATFEQIQKMCSHHRTRMSALKRMESGSSALRCWRFMHGYLPSVWSVPGLYFYRMAYRMRTAIRRCGRAHA